jgi:hypothetical protein
VVDARGAGGVLGQDRGGEGGGGVHRPRSRAADKGHDAFLLDEPAMTSAAKGFIAAAARERGL